MAFSTSYPQSGSASTANVRANMVALKAAGLFTNLIEDKNPDFAAWTNGAAAAPDDWTLAGAGAAVAQDADEHYGTYAAKITYGAADAYLYLDLSELDYYKDKYVSLTARVKTSTASIARLTINDGVGSSNSSYHTGGGTYELLGVSRQLDSNATQVRIELHVTGAGNALFDCIVLAEGEIQAEAFPPVMLAIGASKFSYGSYVGDGNDNRNITSVGFDPNYVVIKGDTTNAAVHRSSSMAGDSTMFYANVANDTNRIQDLITDGFQIGTASNVNTNAITYYYMAWKEGY